MKILRLVPFIICLTVLAGYSATQAQTQLNDTQLYGVCYGPFGGIENPACGPYPKIAQIKLDLAQLKKHTNRIRIYSLVGVQMELAKVAHDMGFFVIGGAWIGKFSYPNDQEIKALLTAEKNGYLNMAIVGNEVMAREDLTAKNLALLIRRVKREVSIPVGYAEVWTTWMDNPELAKEVDIVFAHIYDYWGGTSIEKAAKSSVASYKKIAAAFPDKKVIIGEIGWPKAGNPIKQAYPGLENQKLFTKEFLSLAKSNSIPYYYFEAFDEPWKVVQEGGVGPAWGIYFLKKDVPIVPPLVNKFPFVVYDDVSLISPFIPSGFMGDTHSLAVDAAYPIKPQSGETCIEIKYDPNTQNHDPKIPNKGWAGIYWLYPENNWGVLPGYKFQGVKSLTFWARSDDRAICKFGTGGISSGKEYQDSLGTTPMGQITLTQQWYKFTIKIPQKDLDCVISSLNFAIEAKKNSGVTSIYIDQIQYE